jgi:hypothetical protein
LIASERDHGASRGVWSAATIAEEEDDDQIELPERPRCLRQCAAWA